MTDDSELDRLQREIRVLDLRRRLIEKRIAKLSGGRSDPLVDKMAEVRDEIEALYRVRRSRFARVLAWLDRLRHTPL